jgi:hypothetical protein
MFFGNPAIRGDEIGDKDAFDPHSGEVRVGDLDSGEIGVRETSSA